MDQINELISLAESLFENGFDLLGKEMIIFKVNTNLGA